MAKPRSGWASLTSVLSPPILYFSGVDMNNIYVDACKGIQRLSLLAITGDVFLTFVFLPNGSVQTPWATLLKGEGKVIAGTIDGINVYCFGLNNVSPFMGSLPLTNSYIYTSRCSINKQFHGKVIKTTDDVNKVLNFVADDNCGTIDSLPLGLRKWLRDARRCVDFDSDETNFEAALNTALFELSTFPKTIYEGLHFIGSAFYELVSMLSSTAADDAKVIPYTGPLAIAQLYYLVTKAGCNPEPITWSLLGAILG